MPDNPELQWIPDETTQAIPFRTRVVGVVVFAAIFLAIGFAIGHITAGIPAGTNLRPPNVVEAPSTKKPGEYGIETPTTSQGGNGGVYPSMWHFELAATLILEPHYLPGPLWFPQGSIFSSPQPSQAHGLEVEPFGDTQVLVHAPESR